jgi:hypothetical protein
MAELDIIGMFERLAEHGHAPEEGCKLFGVGYDDAFERLKQKYLIQRFGRGGSAEKFVVGPFGSGKTHFLRQLMEIGREVGCATAEVPLNKDVDFTHNLLVFREVASEIRVPDQSGRGIRTLLKAILARVQTRAQGAGLAAEEAIEGWVSGLEEANLDLEAYARVARRGLEAEIRGDQETFENACRWLGGDMSDKAVSRSLSTSAVGSGEQNLMARRAMLSLFQLIRHAGFPGTVVGYDEAEQAFSVDKTHMARILSLLQSQINAMADLENGSALVIYALTPDLREKMETFPALQQRVIDPGPQQGFFDGNTLAPLIDLTRRPDPETELLRIGERLVSVFCDRVPEVTGEQRTALMQQAQDVSREIAASEPSASSRRGLVKRMCTLVMAEYERGSGQRPSQSQAREPEV